MNDLTKMHISNLDRLRLELREKDYFKDSKRIYYAVLEENGLDPCDSYDKANDQVPMLESVYTILQMLSNDIDAFRKIETEFTTVSAAYQYLQKRLKDLRDEIDRVKLDTHYEDESGNVSSLTSYMWYNGTKMAEEKKPSSSGSNSEDSDSVIHF